MTREAAALAVIASRIEPLARAVLGAIVAHGAVEADGFVWVGPVSDLASAACVSERACRDRLTHLAGLGMVTRQHRGAPRVPFAAMAERHVAPDERHVVPVERHAVPFARRVAPEGPAETVEDARPARGAVQTARGAGREDGTALAIHACAPAQDSLLVSFQETVLARARAEVVENLASAPPHEAPPAAGLASAMTPDVMASLGELEAARGWQFVPPVWVDAAIASATAHGAEATAAAIRSIAAWAAPKAPGGRGGIPKVEWLAERAKTASERATLAPTPAGGGTWRGGRVGGLAGRAEVMADAVEESRATQAARVAWSQTPDGREHAERIAATLREQAANPLLAGM